MPWLAAAIVQKVERPLGELFLLTLRLPGKSVSLAIVGGRDGVLLGPIDRAALRAATSPRKADAETMRWRSLLEGARVIDARAREDGSWARVAFLRGGERTVALATKSGVTLTQGDAGTPDGGENGEGARVLADADESAIATQTQTALTRLLGRRFEARRTASIAAIDRARKKLERRVQAVRGDLAKIGEADAIIARATLLSSHAHRAARGAKELVVEDWSSGEAVAIAIALDPAKSAREQADALFHRGKRLRRGGEHARARLAEAERSAERLSSLRALAERAGSDEELERVERAAEALGVGKASALRGRAGEKAAPRKPYTRYRSGAHEVLVGRGAKDNDALTTSVARPWDLWLHAKGTPGAHVVVPLTKGKTCPSDVLVDAAHLAAHFSDARGETVVEVQWAERRYVRKPKGSAPGAVVVDREKVIVLRVEEKRIERLLATSEA